MENRINPDSKKKVDEIFSKQVRKVEESCIQELYSEICFNITIDVDEKKNRIWVVYDRDLNDPKYAYNAGWDIEPRTDYPDLPSLIFGFKLKNDGRTIAEYCCDFWRQPRLLVPKPIDENLVRKIWRTERHY